MWKIKGSCNRCGRPMFIHFFVWLQSLLWRFLGKQKTQGKGVVLIKKALEFFDEVGPPLVIEPMFRLKSRHSTSNIMTRSDLVQAFYIAQDVSPWVLLRSDTSGFDNSSTKSDNNGFK